MADQQSLNQLLQWGIENSSPSQAAPPTSPQPAHGLNSKMLAELLGGPSDADRMRDAMTAILAPLSQTDLPNKLTAWDNLEQLIEQIDNANNLEPLGLWPPLTRLLDSEIRENRRGAAACCSTAVQNNLKSQERLLHAGAVPKLARLATEDADVGVRKKAITALSSEVRNFQAGMDELEKCLPESVWATRRRGVDAADMEACDEMIQTLRDNSAARG